MDIEDIIDLKKNSKGLICVFGGTGKGKSSCVRNILKHYLQNKTYKFAFVMSPTKYNGDYDFIDPKYVHTFDRDLLYNYIKTLDNICKENYNKKIKPLLPANILVLDDFLGRIKKSDNILDELASVHRHSNMLIIMIIQTLKEFTTNFRDMCHFAIAYDIGARNIPKLYNDLASVCTDMSKEEFKKYYSNIVKQDYHALLIDKRKYQLKDVIFPEFKMPRKVYKFHAVSDQKNDEKKYIEDNKSDLKNTGFFSGDNKKNYDDDEL